VIIDLDQLGRGIWKFFFVVFLTIALMAAVGWIIGSLV
jgi:hypothetical protein